MENIFRKFPEPILIFRRLIEPEDGYEIVKFNAAFRKLNLNYRFMPFIEISDGTRFLRAPGKPPEKQEIIIYIFDKLIEKYNSERPDESIIYWMDIPPRSSQQVARPASSDLTDTKTPKHIFGLRIFKVINGIYCLIVVGGPDGPISAPEFYPDSLIKADLLNIGVFRLEENRIYNPNDVFIKMMGYGGADEIEGRRIEEFIASQYLVEFTEILEKINSGNAEKIGVPIEVKMIKKDGSLIWVKLTFAEIEYNGRKSVIFDVRDTSDENRTLITLLQTHRMASIGDLISGITHEINNPLFGISNYLELLKDAVDEGNHITKNSEEYSFILGAMEETQRISKIINNLSDFSKMRDEQERTPTDIRDLIERTEKLLAHHLRHTHIKVVKEIPNNLPPVRIFKYKLLHVIFNLMLNSIQALENVKRDKKIIRITVELEDIGGFGSEISDKRKVLRITVYDNGEGIPERNLVKVTTPFFTTRRDKKRVGLGLTMVYNIIHHEMNGKITFDSDFGNWTKVVIEIPCD